MRRTLGVWILSVGVCFAAVQVGLAQMSTGAQHQMHQQPADQQKPAMAMEGCKAMMGQREKMMADMGAMDAKLDELVAGMNASQGAAKADATATVVTELVAQRKQMRERMMGMQSEMMGHMMEHMQGGAESMAACPMMKGMAGAKKPGDAK